MTTNRQITREGPKMKILFNDSKKHLKLIFIEGAAKPYKLIQPGSPQGRTYKTEKAAQKALASWV